MSARSPMIGFPAVTVPFTIDKAIAQLFNIVLKTRRLFLRWLRCRFVDVHDACQLKGGRYNFAHSAHNCSIFSLSGLLLAVLH